MPEVPRMRTPITMADASRQLVRAFAARGVALDRDQAALILAQVALETRQGNSCDNHSPGNITAHEQGQREFFRPAWYIIDATSSPKLIDLHNQMLQGKAPNAFRSFNSFEQGFDDYAGELAGRFHAIVNAAATGDALQVAGAIRSSGYTPGINLTQVAASLDSLRRQFLAAGLFPDLPKDEAATTPRC